MFSGPVVLAAQAKVALGDHVGHALGARAVVVLIGERPGLSSAAQAASTIAALLGAARELGGSQGCRSRTPAG